MYTVNSLTLPSILGKRKSADLFAATGHTFYKFSHFYHFTCFQHFLSLLSRFLTPQVRLLPKSQDLDLKSRIPRISYNKQPKNAPRHFFSNESFLNM